MKPSPNSVVRFDCTEEEAKRHDRVSGRRIRRKVKKPDPSIGMADRNPDYKVHEDRLHCKYTFNFFWSGQEQELRDLVAKAEATSDKKFSTCMAMLAGALLLCFLEEVSRFERPSDRNVQNSMKIILHLRKKYQVELSFKKFLDLEEGEEEAYDPETNWLAPTLRNFRATKTFTDFIIGLQLDPSITIDTISPELQKLRRATNVCIGGIVFANLYKNHRTGTTTTTTSDTGVAGGVHGTSTEADSETTAHPESDSSEHRGADNGMASTPVAHKKRKMQQNS
jgi:hypothetical protein